MALILQLYGSDTKNTGHFIIDRNNLIWSYPFEANDKSSLNKAISNRSRLRNVISQQYTHLLPYISYAESFSTTEDPRHDALEHLSDYDRRLSVHSHMILSEDVNLMHLKLFFGNFPTKGVDDLISQECIQNILLTAEQYFLEFKTSEVARTIEEDYRQQKEKEFDEALAKVKATQQSTDQTISQDSNNNNNAAPVAFAFPSLFLNMASFITSGNNNQQGYLSFGLFSLPQTVRVVPTGTVFLLSSMIPSFVFSQLLANNNDYSSDEDNELPRPGQKF